MDKDKLIEMLFARKESLENQINQIEETIEQQRKESEELIDNLHTQIKRIEERAIAEEGRVDLAEKRRFERSVALTLMAKLRK